MIDRLTLNRWLYRLLFVGLAGGIIFVRLVPLDLGGSRFPGPDILLCLTFAWAMRRSDYVPALLIGAVFLVADMLFQRPPGLWPALVLIGLESLRARAAVSRDLPFVIEWAMVAGVMAMMMLVDRMVLALFFVDQVSFGLSILRLFVTIAIYPVIVLLSATLFSVRKITAAEADAMRQTA